MKPTLFLRIASILTLIHCILHTVGGVLAAPKHGTEQVSVIEAMKSHRFDVMGSMRSYWDFFFGYGLIVTLALFVQAVLFWQLGRSIKTNPGSAKPIVLLFFLNYVGMAMISWRYFFIAPALTEALIALSLVLALTLENNAENSESRIRLPI